MRRLLSAYERAVLVMACQSVAMVDRVEVIVAEPEPLPRLDLPRDYVRAAAAPAPGRGPQNRRKWPVRR